MKSLFRLGMFLLALFQVFTQPAIAQPRTTPSDDLVVLLATDQAWQAMRPQPNGVRLYHRLPDHYFAAVSREALIRLRAGGIGVTILDAQPWSSHYFLISQFSKRYLWNDHGIPARTLASFDGVKIVKGDASVAALFRERGFSCVEIEQKPMAMPASRTFAPPTVPTRPNDSITRILGFVSDSSITANIQGLQDFGTRYYANANRDSVFRWVRQRFLNLGITDVVLDSFQYSGTWQKNVIATIPGTTNPSAEIIVGGHLDSYSSNLLQAPGADDNATGTAATIEMARVLIQAEYQPSVTMRFIGFAAEEAGLRGSADYALKARQQNRDIRAMMNYDMIGNRDQGQPDRDFYIVWYPGSESHSNLHGSMATSYTSLSPVMTTSYRSSSDSWSFYQQNYNAVFCIERDFSPYYHSPNDLIQYLDIPYTAEIIKAGLAMLITLDELPSSIAGPRLLDHGNGTSLRVEWDSVYVPDWYRYKVYIGTEPGVYTANYLQTVRNRTFTGLTTGTRYYVAVSIIDLAGNEGMITEVNETPLFAPRRPQGVMVESITEGARLNWNRNNELDMRGYDVYRSIRPDTTFVLMTAQPIVDSSWIDTPLPVGTYRYFVVAVDTTGFSSEPSDTVETQVIVGAADHAIHEPATIKLHQNFPNPFNPTTTLRFTVSGFDGGSLSHVPITMKVYDILGKEVATLVDDRLTSGEYSVVFDARNAASGVYQYVLQAGSVRSSRLMVLLR
jgi:Zn-dependent M28 family amino/carboxypeptidase